jgi:hypothetical protein
MVTMTAAMWATGSVNQANLMAVDVLGMPLYSSGHPDGSVVLEII